MHQKRCVIAVACIPLLVEQVIDRRKNYLYDIIPGSIPGDFFLASFIKTAVMIVPQELNVKLKQEQEEGLSPLVELELTGNISFEDLIDTMYNHYKVPYKLIKADIEYFGKTSYGKLLVHLKGTEIDNNKALQFFKQRKIKNAIKGYA